MKILYNKDKQIAFIFWLTVLISYPFLIWAIFILI